MFAEFRNKDASPLKLLLGGQGCFLVSSHIVFFCDTKMFKNTESVSVYSFSIRIELNREYL